MCCRSHVGQKAKVFPNVTSFDFLHALRVRSLSFCCFSDSGHFCGCPTEISQLADLFQEIDLVKSVET